MDANFNQAMIAPSLIPQNAVVSPISPIMINPGQMDPSLTPPKKHHLHLPALILFAFCWLIHTIATFIPYWSVYSGIADSRAGLWSARNFDYQSIQNFYFPELFSFPTITSSIRFTDANTKGYVVTVQFLMTFNFVMMNILLILLIIDYIISRQPSKSGSVLIRKYNTADTALIYGLLLYVLYVLTVFEFAAWITYVASRHDNNWTMHASFGLTVVVSVFLIGVFVMYAIEFLRIFKRNRSKWEYWYGPYSEWGFFVHLTALLFLLLVICCPEWAYLKTNIIYVFGEIGLFKQCFLWPIFKKSAPSGLCTLSDSRNNQSWVNATQAFMLMAFIFGSIFLILMIIFRKEFRHNARGYDSSRVSQPRFTFIIAGLILFFCFIFSLIGVSIFGANVFPHGITVNWAYILAVFAMVLFLVAGILLLLDGVHSKKQTTAATASPMEKFFFPEPLNTRILAMQPLIKPEPFMQPPPPIGFPPPFPMVPPMWGPQPLFDINQQPPPMYPDLYFDNPSFYPPAANYGMEEYLDAPIAQATLSNYFLQMMNNPQMLSSRNDQGLGNYSADGLFDPPPLDRTVVHDRQLNEMARLQLLQQQRLNYNHERLLERYSHLRAPRVSQYRSFGTSSLPGRNYDEYLQRMRGDDEDYDQLEDSVAAQSRARIGTSDETYRWMGNDSDEPLPMGVSSVFQSSRNDPMPFVRAEKHSSRRISNYVTFERISGYIRSILMRTPTHSLDHREERKICTLNNEIDDHQFVDRMSSEYALYSTRKTNRGLHIDPLLFNLYHQRLNGDIQSYGQSLYTRTNSNNDDVIRSSLVSSTKSIIPTNSQFPLSSFNELDSSVDTPPLETLSTITNDSSTVLPRWKSTEKRINNELNERKFI